VPCTSTASCAHQVQRRPLLHPTVVPVAKAPAAQTAQGRLSDMGMAVGTVPLRVQARAATWVQAGQVVVSPQDRPGVALGQGRDPAGPFKSQLLARAVTEAVVGA
jgi:hypothetical protein